LGDKIIHAKFCPENQKERDHLDDLGIDGRILNRMERYGMDSSGSG
jgi:hypothetical protein